MASPRSAISIFKTLSPTKIQNIPKIRQILSPKTPVKKHTLVVDNNFENQRLSPIFKIDTPYKTRIINEGIFDKCRKVLGNGTFGTVYKASYRGREVAAKIIMNNTGKMNPISKERETAYLNHMNIVKILKVDEGSALTLITMELCGNSLQDIIEENIISKENRIYIWRSIAEALKYCHERGIVHADVKPGNVLMGLDNQPKLTDFGSAIFINEPYTPSDFHGTPGYAAPEVVCGKTPTPSSDIYSLGILAWQMISRKPPFEGLHKHTILYLTGKGIALSDNELEDGFNGKYKDLYRSSWSKQCKNRPSLLMIIERLSKLEVNELDTS